MKNKILSTMTALAVLGVACVHADFDPVPLKPESFTVDVIVEATAPPPLGAYTTATMDGGTNNNSNVWFEQGYLPGHWGLLGLPAAGSEFTAQDDPNRTYKMAPSYSDDNALFLSLNGSPSGTLTVADPKAGMVLSVIGSVAGGATTIEYVVYHQDGSSTAGEVEVPDWFNVNVNRAVTTGGRINVVNGRCDQLAANNPHLYYVDIPLLNNTSPVTKVDFTTTRDSNMALFGLSISSDYATFTPLDVTGFNRDMVVEAGAPVTGGLFDKCNVIMDDGATNLTGNTWYEIGFNKAAPTTGLPAAGTDISGGTPLHTFTMPASYAVNNCLYLGPYEGYTSGTLTLTTPVALNGLSFLGAAGNGPVNASVTVHFADASVEYYTLSIADWFGNDDFYIARGRFVPANLAFNNVNDNNPRLHLNDITLANTSTAVTRVDFEYTSGGRAMIFAVAGQATSGGEFTPLAFSGFNADGVVEAAAGRYPNPLLTPVTATMDSGINLTAPLGDLNTWYEQGYYRNRPDTGLPPAGAVLQSQVQPDHYYQMPASYTANNAAYVDADLPEANLTIAEPATYSALSFLSATANGTVTNQAIMQYADGTSETNTFLSRDWFNNTPYAFTAKGRVELGSRTVNNVGSDNPRLYEAQFVLKNTASPVTNIVLRYLNPPSSNARMYVFAVSATAGDVPPIITSVSVTPSAALEGGEVVFAAVISGGTEPITYQWQKSVDGAYVDLVDSATISGATTATMTISGVTPADVGDYRLVASNVIGPVPSGVVSLLRVLSNLPDITSPKDSIHILTGTTPGAEGVEHAIDNRIQKYLNFGVTGNNPPFVGPVGFILQPAIGNTIVSALRFYTANDAEARDPADYVLEGSLDGVDYFPIASGALALPAGRNTATGDAIDPFAHYCQEVRFANTTGYNFYRLSFNNVKNNAAAVAMQIGEIEFLGVVNPNPPPRFTLSPVNVSANEGTTATFTSLATGAAPLAYRWYEVTGGDPGVLLAEQTGPNLVLPNVTVAQNGSSYRVVAYNPYGAVTNPAPSQPGVQLTVNSGPVYLSPDGDLPTETVGYAGRTVRLSVGAVGTAPTYQWWSNGVALVDGGRISGATSDTLAIANAQPSDAASYHVEIANAYGGPISSTPTALDIVTVPTFHGDGVGWQFVNAGGGGSHFPLPDVMLMTWAASQQQAAWLSIPMYVDGFQISFVYQDLGPAGDGAGGGADGFAVVLQNAPAGLQALGGAGGDLGYAGIDNSVALAFNIYANNNVGIAFFTNGVVNPPYAPTPPVNIAGGHPIQVNLAYDGAIATVRLQDLTTDQTFDAALPVGSIASIIGTNVAYVGITAATGGIAAHQQFSNFQYVPRPVLAAAPVDSGILLTWPAAVGGYAPAVSSSLISGPWTVLTGMNNQTNDLHHRVVAPSGDGQYYRLVMPLP